MTEGDGDAPGVTPYAPHDAVTLAEARRRWDAYRADIWLTLAEVRGQGARERVLKRLRPGSIPFRVAAGVAGPLLALRRRLRASAGEVTTAPSFPYGDEPSTLGWHRPLKVNDVDLIFVSGVDPGADTARANDRAAGEGWLMVLDDGDELIEGALNVMAVAGATNELDFVFGDERVRDARGTTVVARPHSAGWVSLLSRDVTGRAVLFRRAALRAVGGFDAAAGSSFRRDAVVRLVESGSSGGSVGVTVMEHSRPDAPDAESVAGVTVAALARRAGGGVAVVDASTPNVVRWNPAAPSAWPLVSIVIPTRDRLDLLAPCLDALEGRTTYRDYEVVIVDNDSSEPETLRFFAETRHRVVRAPGAFNYARVVNQGVLASTGDFVVTLNNDVTVVTADWLEQMVGVAGLPGVGVVGVYLQDPSGHAQHEGVAIAPYPQHLRRDRNYLVPDAYLESTREVSAVTGACQMFSRALFDDLGGLDEGLAVVHNDIDLCLRAARTGRSVVYVATVRHLHAESSSRGRLTPEEDIERFIARWDVFGSLRDPWFPSRWELIGDVIRWRRPSPSPDAG